MSSLIFVAEIEQGGIEKTVYKRGGRVLKPIIVRIVREKIENSAKSTVDRSEQSANSAHSIIDRYDNSASNENSNLWTIGLIVNNLPIGLLSLIIVQSALVNSLSCFIMKQQRGLANPATLWHRPLSRMFHVEPPGKYE